MLFENLVQALRNKVEKNIQATSAEARQLKL